MKANSYWDLFLLVLILVLLSHKGYSQDRLILSAKGHKKVTTLSNALVSEGKLKLDSDLSEIDSALASEFPDVYGNFCKAALNGPSIFYLPNPIRSGSKNLIGFTEKGLLEKGDIEGDRSSLYGRSVYYWDQSLLRAVSYTEDNFQKLVSNYKIDISDSKPFRYPGLVSAIKSKPYVDRISPSGKAPSYAAEAARTNAASISKITVTRTSGDFESNIAGQEPGRQKDPFGFLMIVSAFVLTSIIVAIVIRKKIRSV